MTEKFSRWDSADYLKTEEDVALYIQACIDEDPGDGSLIRAALGDIARAQGTTDASVDAVSAEGTLDALRYGSLLQPRALVGVRGAGYLFTVQSLQGQVGWPH